MPDSPEQRDLDRLAAHSGRAWQLRAILVSASVAITLGLFETVLRIVDDTPWYERLVEEQTPVALPRFRVGDEVFKVRRPLIEAKHAKPGTYRILFLGDSFTYGSGIPDEASLFATRVTLALADRREGNWPDRFQFYNGGIPGSLTRHWVSLYRESVDLLNPDLVVAVFFLRDGVRHLGSTPELARIRDAMQNLGRESFLFRNSRLYRRLVEKRRQREFGQQYFDSMRSGYVGSQQETQEWENAQRNLLDIRDDSLERGADFAFVVFPILFDLEADYPLQGVLDEIERFAQFNHIPTLDLLSAFEGGDAAKLWVSPLDQHPNEAAHAIAADAITEFLAERIAETNQ